MFGAYLSWAFFNPPVIPIFLFVEKRFPSQYKLEIVGTNLRYPAVKVVVNGYGTKLFFVKSGFGSQKSAANLYTPWPPMCSWKKARELKTIRFRWLCYNYPNWCADWCSDCFLKLRTSCTLSVSSSGFAQLQKCTNFKNRCACLCFHEI